MVGISFHSGGMVDKPLSSVIKILSEAGYDGIEIVCGPRAHIHPDEATAGHLQALRENLDKCRLKAAAINPYTVKPLAEMELEGGAQAFFRKLIDIAVALGAPTVNFLPGRLPASDTDGWRTLVTALKPLLHYAGERGINMTIHNHENHILDTPDKVRLIIEEIGLPNLKALCDITNFYILGSDIGWSVDRIGEHMIHSHVKGVIGKFPFNHFLVPGEPGDEFPFDEFSQALKMINYQGMVSVETFSFWREDKHRIAYDMIARSLKAHGLRD